MSVIRAFENWSFKIIDNAEELEGSLWEQSYNNLFCRVLLTLDQDFFSILSKYKSNVSEIEERICEYFHRYQHINKKAILEKDLEADMMSETEVEYMFSLIFELSIRIDQSSAIGHIRQLSNDDQETLVPFVKEAIKDMHKIPHSPKADSAKMKTQDSDMMYMSELEMKEHELRELTERNEILQRRLKESDQKQDFFLEQNNRLFDELEQMRSERQTLLSEMTLPYTSGYHDILIRIKDIKKAYERDIETLHKTIEQQKHDLDHNSFQMERMTHSLVQFKKDSLLAKDTEIQDSLRDSLQKLSIELNTKGFELKQLASENKHLREDVDKLKKKCSKLEPVYCKYKTLEGLHNNFLKAVSRQFEKIK